MPPKELAGQPTPATEAAQTNAATTEAHTDGAEVETESPVEKTFTQKELDEIIQKRLAKAQRTARRDALQEFQALTQREQPQPAKEAHDDRPARKDGETDEDYFDRMADWKLDQRDRKAAKEREKQNAEALAKKTDSIYAEAVKLDGFDRDAFDELPLTRPIVEALIDSDNAPALMKHMADNPDDIERIAKLSPARQAAELGKLEARLASEPPPKKVSSTPEPLSPIRKPSGAAKTYDTTDPRAAKELSTSEWIRQEEARMRRKLAGG